MSLNRQLNNSQKDKRGDMSDELPEIEVIHVLNCRVTFIHLGSKLSFLLLRFFQVRSDFLFLSDFSVHALSDESKNNSDNSCTKISRTQRPSQRCCRF